MLWKIAHLVLLVLAVSVGLTVQRSLWGANYNNAKIVFGVFLISLVMASVASFSTKPRWRRLWMGYTVFGWAWLVFVLRDYLGLIPDVYSSNMIDYSLLGMAFGFLCALGCHYLPGMR